MTSVLICDERRGVRDGLAQFMSVVPGVDRVDTVASGDDMLERYPRERPDVVLVGTQRAVDTGIVLTRRLVSPAPAGLRARLRRRRRHREHRGRGRPAAPAATCAGTRRTRRSARRWRTRWPASSWPGRGRLRQDTDVRLTARELQVLVGMTEGKSNGEIGRELFLSEDTVKTHARRLFRKLGVNDRAQAVAHGFRRGLVS